MLALANINTGVPATSVEAEGCLLHTLPATRDVSCRRHCRMSIPAAVDSAAPAARSTMYHSNTPRAGIACPTPLQERHVACLEQALLQGIRG